MSSPLCWPKKQEWMCRIDKKKLGLLTEGFCGGVRDDIPSSIETWPGTQGIGAVTVLNGQGSGYCNHMTANSGCFFFTPNSKLATGAVVPSY